MAASATATNKGYTVSGNQAHTVYIKWQDLDTGSDWYSKQETKNVPENTTIPFSFIIDLHEEPQEDTFVRLSLDNNDDDMIQLHGCALV